MATLGVPPRWLGLKLENMFSRLKHFADGAYDEDPNPYTVSWKESLGQPEKTTNALLLH